MQARAEIVTIGDELLSGETTDTNASWLDGQLGEWGWAVERHTTVLDDVGAIAAALREAAARVPLVIVSGGLGPTQDDVTLEALGRALGVPMRIDEPTVERIRGLFARLGREMTPNNVRQATVPSVGEILVNEVGTAPAFTARLGTADVYLVPGVPREMRYLAENVIRPRIAREQPVIFRETLKVIGLGESRLEHEIRAVVKAQTGARIGYRALGAESHVKLAAADAGTLAAAVAAVRQVLGGQVYGSGSDTIERVVIELLRARGETVATAESCTGGLVAKRLTDVPGSSAVVLGGAVAYANAVKTTMVGVPEAMLAEHGAVSEAVARALAAGIRDRTGASWGLSTTGVAGPSGGSDAKPVGLVWVAIAGAAGVEARELRLPGDREQIRGSATSVVLELLRRRATTTG